MKIMIVVLALVLGGCGGAAFSAAETGDGGGPLKAPADTDTDSGDTSDDSGDTAATDSGVVVDSSVDSGSPDSGSDLGSLIDSSSTTETSIEIDSSVPEDACAPVTHSNGFGGMWTDCEPLGTYNEAQAMKACGAQAVAAGVGTCDPIVCTIGTAVAWTTGNIVVVWAYTGSFAGYLLAGGCPNGSGGGMWN